jgi:RNA polymerase sigma-70 factor (ECF subfamily)
MAPGAALGGASEAAVVVLAMNGDDAAFGELVRRRQGALRNLLRRLSRDAALADDLAQQAFVLAWKSIRTLKAPGAFGAWLRRLAINCWLQQARAAAHTREVSLDEEAVGEDRADVSAWPSRSVGAASGATLAESRVAERLDLDAALARLPPDARLCVVLAYSEGMSHAEISDSTALPLGTVKSHIARGAARLRELLQAYGEHHAR